MKFDKNVALTLLGEFSATAMLMFFLPLSCVHTYETYPIFANNPTQISIGCGLTVYAVLQVFIRVSGAHINPVVSIAYWIAGNMSFTLMLLYWLVQFFGAVLGYAFFVAVIPWDVIVRSPSLTVVHPAYSNWNAFCMEFAMTGIIILFCCSVWDPRNSQRTDGLTLKFGCLLTFLNLVGERGTGASVNPVHTIVPGLFHNHFTKCWVYLSSQFLSGISMSLLWRFVFYPKKKREVERP